MPGGDYVDMTTPFGMRDKVAHALCGALLFAAVNRQIGPWWAWFAVLAGGLVVELLEVWRKKHGKVFLADDFSWRDIVANVVGATLGWGLL